MSRLAIRLAAALLLVPVLGRAADIQTPPHQVADDGSQDQSRRAVILEPGLDPRVVEGLEKGFDQAGDFPSSVRIVISPHSSPLSPIVRVYAHGGMDVFYLHEVQDRIRELSYGKYDPRRLLPQARVDAYDFVTLGKMYGEFARLVAAMKQCGARPCRD